MNVVSAGNSSVAERIYSDDELSLLDLKRLPAHIAIIMDGNRRWSKQKDLPINLGHLKGVDSLTKIVAAAAELNIKVLTVYAFSTENWERSQEEIEHLMRVFKTYLPLKKDEMVTQGVKLDYIGDIGGLPPDLVEILKKVKAETQGGSSIELVLALNYGSRNEIKRATQSIVRDCMEGKLSQEEISEELFSSYLDTAKWQDPDLFIRTSGEQRLSNFLLWQMCYTEVYITGTLWPDFDEKDFLKAILAYQQRQRRHGA